MDLICLAIQAIPTFGTYWRFSHALSGYKPANAKKF